MFCPKCGGIFFEATFGGSSRDCIYCGQAINCRNSFTDEIEKDSLLILNIFKAIFLRIKYNADSEKKKKGKENLRKCKKFKIEVKRAHLIILGKKGLRN